MNRCEHGQKIAKFCITEHCHHKEAAGCDYCIRKYHCHLTSTLLLSEPDLQALIKNITLPTDIKYKARNLQEAAIDYLRNIKLSISSWIDQAQNSIADRLCHPTLRKQGLLLVYNRLRQKDYRKINAKELRIINEFAKSSTPESLKKEELAGYYEEVDWTMGIVGAVEKVAAEIYKLPEAKEGEGTLPLINKNKLNDIYDSIRKEKEKREIQSRMVGIQANTNSQGLKLEDNPLLKRRQSAEKKPPENTEPANQIRQMMERKGIDLASDEVGRPKFIVEREKSGKQAANNSSQAEARCGLRRRRSSIQDKFDLKFGAGNEDKVKEQRENEERKKKLVEKIEHERKLSQDRLEKREQPKPRIQREYSQKTAREEESIIGNLLTLKLASKREEFPKREDESSFMTQSQEASKKTPAVDKTQYTDMDKSEVSSNKVSESNFMGMMAEVLNNILPPLPPSAPRTHAQDTYVEKVVKIPVVMNQVPDEIQSPIFKTKKRQQDKDKQSSPFGIVLIPTADKVVEKAGQAANLIGKQKEKEVQKPKEQKVKQKEKEDELIVLEKNQQNSLLLMSQALKSPGDRAIELLKAALKYSPENLSAAEYLSYLYLQGGKSKQCIEVCQSILVQIEDTPEEFQLTLHLHNNKAAALNQLGRYSQSIMILQKCLRFRRKHYFYKNLGDAYFCLGIPEKAAMNYDKAIKLDPQSDQAYYNLSVTQFMQEQYTSANLNITQAIKLEPSNENYLQLSQQIQKRLANLAM